MRESESVNVNTIFDIRRARGLSYRDKALLYTIEGRGVLFSSAKNTAADAGMSLSTDYKAVDSLMSLGLITAERTFAKHGGAMPTRYRVDAAALRKLIPKEEGVPVDPKDGQGSTDLDRLSPNPARPASPAEGPPAAASRALLRAAVDKEDPEDDPSRRTDKITFKNTAMRTPQDRPRPLATPSPGGSGCSTAPGSTSEVSSMDRTSQSLDPFEVGLVVDLTVNANPPIDGVRTARGPIGEQMIELAGLAPMVRSDVVERLRVDHPRLQRVMDALPQDQLAEALRIGPEEYELNRLRELWGQGTSQSEW